MPADTCLLGFPDYRDQALALARAAELDYAEVELHRFPDGESRLVLPTSLPRNLVICRSLDRPNPKLVELMLAADAARQQGVERLLLVAPYLCYMRQDKAFQPGEVVSQTLVGQFLADHFDAVVTVDAHLHRISRLSQAIPLEQAHNLSAAEAMGHFVRENRARPLLVGPDAESEQWVAAIAAHDRLDYCIAQKRRSGDREVEVSLPDYDFAGRDVVLVDDVASTGTTLEMAAAGLRGSGVASISVLVTHALFVGDACARLEAAGVENIWSCDSIEHESNRVSLAPLLAEGLLGLLAEPQTN
jgi:ribose-phosphate pyrophosphokinase